MRKYLAAILILAIGLSLIFIVNTCSKTTSTVGKMSDQTVFNASKHVWTYEQFRKNKADFDQHMLTWKNFHKQAVSLEEKNRYDSQEYNNSVMARDGAYQMMARISADYNKMSEVAYQNVWKGDLPERLDMPDITQLH